MIAGSVFSRHRQPKQFRTPVDLIIDECHLVLSSDIKTLLSEARKFGLHLTLAQQHVGQEMDPRMKNTVLTNTSVKILGGQARTNLMALAPDFRKTEKDIPSLRPGWFFTRTYGRNHLIKLPTRFLGTKREASKKTWQKVKTRQLQLFYTEDQNQR